MKMYGEQDDGLDDDASDDAAFDNLCCAWFSGGSRCNCSQHVGKKLGVVPHVLRASKRLVVVYILGGRHCAAH